MGYTPVKQTIHTPTTDIGYRMHREERSQWIHDTLCSDT